ncbi:hypothetical protein CHELA1G11_14069 [Hyphomicrobiales bacterium]|nr:hypothetical protein CHELA1G2_10245 [Hyphomicrobiales bacterium]CAH1676005.1 hypothetical protein CHELA1G11_14069 [Hyphomicrobiales bacterium]
MVKKIRALSDDLYPVALDGVQAHFRRFLDQLLRHFGDALLGELDRTRRSLSMTLDRQDGLIKALYAIIPGRQLRFVPILHRPLPAISLSRSPSSQHSPATLDNTSPH